MKTMSGYQNALCKNTLVAVFLGVSASSAVSGDLGGFYPSDVFGGKIEAYDIHRKFCEDSRSENTDYCPKYANPVTSMPLSPSQLENLNDFNRTINDKINYVEDQALYGIKDHWTIANKAGDCEDIASRKYAELLALGVDGRFLFMVSARTEQGQGHMVLGWLANDALWILDNRTDKVHRHTDFERAGYVFLGIQDPHNRKEWRDFQTVYRGVPGKFVAEHRGALLMTLAGGK